MFAPTTGQRALRRILDGAASLEKASSISLLIRGPKGPPSGDRPPAHDGTQTRPSRTRRKSGDASGATVNGTTVRAIARAVRFRSRARGQRSRASELI